MSGSVASRPTLWLRVLQFPFSRILILGSIIALLMAINNGFIQQFKSRPLLAIAATIGMAAVALAIYLGFARWIERRLTSELSLAGMDREWATGALIGALLYCACVLILIVLGVYRIEGLNPWTVVIPAIAMALGAGLFEELLFRGVLFRSLEDMLGTWAALLVSSLVFGLVHLTNPAATVVGAIYISVEAGLLLAAAYTLTRRLWLSIGVHMAWNYTQSAIFSGIVSGNAPEPGLIRSNIKGPDVLTGGSFGLEASAIAFGLCTLAGVVLLIMAMRRGNIVPPPWKRAV